MQSEQLALLIKDWLEEVSQLIKTRLSDPLIVEEKSNRSDLVTNVDKEVETFFVTKIKESFPEDKILGEEGICDKVDDFSGRVWVIDPIDGTLNFVKQQENFCTMLAVYEDGIGQLGFIYEIMTDELLWAAKGKGAYLNSKRIEEVKDRTLSEGIVSINTRLFLEDTLGLQKFALNSLAVRMTGCAGLAFKEVVKGNFVAYVSRIQPWDYAAARVIFEEVGLELVNLTGKSLELDEKVIAMGATPAVYREYVKQDSAQ